MYSIKKSPAKTSADFTYLRELPLLEVTKNLYPLINLEKTYIICAQHIVSTTYSLFYSLIQLGLLPQNLAVIGKCYSTDPHAYQKMENLGIDLCASSKTFNSKQSFDFQYKKNIKKFIENRLSKLKNNYFERVIVLDDGGILLSEIADHLNNIPNAVGIEQTSSGFYKLAKKSLPIPIINVARSDAKLQFESPIIARLISESLASQLHKNFLSNRKALIIGSGFIGAQIRETLKATYDISTYDTLSSKSDFHKNDFEKILKNFDIIIGCTGSSALTPKQFKLLKKNVALVSTSSSDREFHAVSLRKKIPAIQNCHETVFVDDIFLPNCGFPINFSSDFRAIDSNDLQLTRALLLAAILQAASINKNSSLTGFLDLDIENQREIITHYLSLFQINTREKIII